MDDPVTGRRMLTESAYADDRHLRSRMAIFRYAQTRPDPGWRTDPVHWDGTQVVADIGCGNGLDLRQLVPGGRCRHAIGVDLSAGMLRALADLTGTGRLTLIQADAQRLPLGDNSVDVALAMYMLYHVPDVDAAAAELRRIVKPGGTVLAGTNGSDTMAEVHGLLDAAVSRAIGRPVRALPALSFTLETGHAILARQFSSITTYRKDGTLAFPSAQPVVGYLDSVREPVLRLVGEPFDFDAVLDDIAGRVDRVIAAEGSFRTTTRSGVFACR